MKTNKNEFETKIIVTRARDAITATCGARRHVDRAHQVKQTEPIMIRLSDSLRSECAERCGCEAYCIVQHCRCPRRQDATRHQQREVVSGKTEGGKGVGGEREGHPSHFRNVIILLVLFGLSSVF